MLTGEVKSAEALLRMQQPDGSWELPEGFIERIESCGLMVTVGYWVLEESCRQLAAWQARGVTLPLSVNLSALQLMHPTMVSEMLELIHRYRIQPDTLILEVTESRRIDDPNEAVAILKPLRNAGIRIALDDFGVSELSLPRVWLLEPDAVKLHERLLHRALSIPCARAALPQAVTVLHQAGCQVVAEGVDSARHAELAREAGCDGLQGSWVSKLLPATGR